MDKLFVVVRADLAPGAQCAQACHTARAFAEAHPELDRAWYGGANNLVVLSVPDEAALETLISRAARARLAHAIFREPDFDNALTGLALEGAAAPLVSCFPLALRGPRCVECREPVAALRLCERCA